MVHFGGPRPSTKKWCEMAIDFATASWYSVVVIVGQSLRVRLQSHESEMVEHHQARCCLHFNLFVSQGLNSTQSWVILLVDKAMRHFLTVFIHRRSLFGLKSLLVPPVCCFWRGHDFWRRCSLCPAVILQSSHAWQPSREHQPQKNEHQHHWSCHPSGGFWFHGSHMVFSSWKQLHGYDSEVNICWHISTRSPSKHSQWQCLLLHQDTFVEQLCNEAIKHVSVVSVVVSIASVYAAGLLSILDSLSLLLFMWLSPSLLSSLLWSPLLSS